MHHKGLGVDSDERELLSAALDNGQAAVGALVKSSVAAGVMNKLPELGGDTRMLTPSDEAVAEVDAVGANAQVGDFGGRLSVVLDVGNGKSTMNRRRRTNAESSADLELVARITSPRWFSMRCSR